MERWSAGGERGRTEMMSPEWITRDAFLLIATSLQNTWQLPRFCTRVDPEASIVTSICFRDTMLYLVLRSTWHSLDLRHTRLSVIAMTVSLACVVLAVAAR